MSQRLGQNVQNFISPMLSIRDWTTACLIRHRWHLVMPYAVTVLPKMERNATVAFHRFIFKLVERIIWKWAANCCEMRSSISCLEQSNCCKILVVWLCDWILVGFWSIGLWQSLILIDCFFLVVQNCDNHCCNAASCTVMPNATCAVGGCCDLLTCQVGSLF